MELSFLILFCITAGATFTQGFSGFGCAIVMMSCFSMFNLDLERASVFTTLIVFVLAITMLLRTRGHMRVDWKAAGLVMAGILFTTPIGYQFILRHGDMPVARIIFGLVLVLFALNRMFKPHVKKHVPRYIAPLFGMFSGLLSGAFSAGGPPVVMYLYIQEEDPRMAVGTAQAIFLGSSIYRLSVIMAGERGISSELMLQALTFMPVVIACSLVGFYTARKFSVRPFLIAVYGLIILAGAVNVIKGLTA